MKIIKIYQKKNPVFSIEICPQKSEQELNPLFKLFDTLSKFKIDFFSVTSAPFGKEGGNALTTAIILKEKYHLEPLLHLTCGDKTKKELKDILFKIKKGKIQNILALRGDVKKEKGCNLALELIREIKQNFPSRFCIGVAGYPETPPDCPSFKKNIEYLKLKVKEGADFIITQIFFDLNKFLRFRERLEKERIFAPVVPGIFLLTKYSQALFFEKRLKITLPKKLKERIEKEKGKKEIVRKICREHIIGLCRELLENGVPGLHFFTKNQVFETQKILEVLSK